MIANEVLSKVFAELQRVEEHTDFWTSLCPAHDDSEPSLSISLGDDGRVLLNCHKGCDPINIVQCMGMKMKDLYPTSQHREEKKKTADRGQLVATYDYHDASGELVFQVCRYEKTESHGGQDRKVKTFLQRRPSEKSKGGWTYSMKGVQRELYGLLDILHRVDDPVWIVEGEKAADYCRSLGLLATTSAGGAKKSWEDQYNTVLSGRDVIIIPDHDPITENVKTRRMECVGRERAEQVADAIVGIAKSVHVVELPGAEAKWGLDDWLQAGNPLQALADLLHDATPWAKGSLLFHRAVDSNGKPVDPEDDKYAFEKKCCEDIGIYVLGESHESRVPSVMVYSTYYKKTQQIPDLSKWRYANLLQFAGPPAKEKIFIGQDDCPPGQYRLSDVTQSIACLAGSRSVETSLLGAGIWRINDSIVLVGAGECAVLEKDGEQFEQRLTPEFDDRVFDLRSSNSWFDLKYLNECLPLAQDPAWRKDIVQELDSYFRQWNFQRGEHVPQLLTGLVLATWVQSIWRWRPQVFLFGQSNCGKTTMMQLLCGQDLDATGGIFGGLSLYSSDYTAAAIRQGIGRSSKLVFLDEMENGRNRKEFLILARGSGRGSNQIRGSQSGNKMISTRLAQIFWCASTETGLEREMDANRYLVVELLQATNPGKLVLPTDAEALRLGQRLMLSMLVTADRAIQLAKQMEIKHVPGVPGRVIESFSVPAAAYAAVCGMTDEEAYQLLLSMVGSYEPESVQSDSQTVLDAIMGSMVDLGHGRREVVSQIVKDEFKGEYVEQDRQLALERVGLKVVIRDERLIAASGNEEKYLFVSHNQARRHLLKDTDWRDQKIDERLTRFPGTFKTKKKVAGSLIHGVMIPRRVLAGITESS